LDRFTVNAGLESALLEGPIEPAGFCKIMKVHEHVPAKPAIRAPVRIALVDEAPNNDATCSGRILSGYQGQLLRRALRLANIEYDELYITYLFDFQLPSDDVRKIGLKTWQSEDYYGYTPRRLPGTGYLPPDATAQLERVAQELETVKPAVIMPLGATVYWAFTGSTGITSARGTISRAEFIAPGVKIVPTFRPGFVHRQYKMLGTWVNDFERAMIEAERPTEVISRSHRELWIEPTYDDIAHWAFTILPQASRITVDIETAKGQISWIGFGASADRAISIPFVDYRQPNRCYWPTWEAEWAVWQLVAWILTLPNPKQFQHGTYDAFYIVRYGMHISNWRYDTRLLHKILYPELPADLAYQGAAYTWEGPWKLLADHNQTKEVKEDA
jgi:uracil-DNA glycosylase